MAIPGYWYGGYGRVAGPRRLQYPIGWGTLGYALPAAIGAACARDRPVLAVCGDGGFMYAVGELAVLREQDLPVTVLVVDDGGYGMLRYDQDRAGDAHRGVDLFRPDFAALASRSASPPITSRRRPRDSGRAHRSLSLRESRGWWCCGSPSPRRARPRHAGTTDPPAPAHPRDLVGNLVPWSFPLGSAVIGGVLVLAIAAGFEFEQAWAVPGWVILFLGWCGYVLFRPDES